MGTQHGARRSHMLLKATCGSRLLHACLKLGLCGCSDVTLSAQVSLDEIGSLAERRGEWAFGSGLSFMGFFSLAVFGEETSGREGRQSSGPTTEYNEIGGPSLPFREHVGGHGPFPLSNQISKKSGVRMTQWRNDHWRTSTSPTRVTYRVGNE